MLNIGLWSLIHSLYLSGLVGVFLGHRYHITLLHFYSKWNKFNDLIELQSVEGGTQQSNAPQSNQQSSRWQGCNDTGMIYDWEGVCVGIWEIWAVIYTQDYLTLRIQSTHSCYQQTHWLQNMIPVTHLFFPVYLLAFPSTCPWEVTQIHGSYLMILIILAIITIVFCLPNIPHIAGNMV